MFCQICALSETLMAALNWTPKGLLIGMDSQMIEEVASFSELFMATRVLTLHDSSDSSCFYVLIPQYFVICSVRNMLAFAYRVESLCIFQTIFLCYNLTNRLRKFRLVSIKFL